MVSTGFKVCSACSGIVALAATTERTFDKRAKAPLEHACHVVCLKYIVWSVPSTSAQRQLIIRHKMRLNVQNVIGEKWRSRQVGAHARVQRRQSRSVDKYKRPSARKNGEFQAKCAQSKRDRSTRMARAESAAVRTIFHGFIVLDSPDVGFLCTKLNNSARERCSFTGGIRSRFCDAQTNKAAQVFTNSVRCGMYAAKGARKATRLARLDSVCVNIRICALLNY